MGEIVDDEADLRKVFKKLQSNIIKDVNPDSVIDELYSKNIISGDDYNDLSYVPDRKRRCRNLLGIVRDSSDPKPYSHLRDALRNEYPWIYDEIVDEVNKLRKPEQPPPVKPVKSAGKFLLPPCINVTFN